jgi:hypothetical protein
VSQELSPFGARLVRVLPTATTTGSAAEVVDHLDLLSERLRSRLDLLEAWRLRFPLLPEPPARESLQDLVQEARRRLREERSSADDVELRARLDLVDRLREGLLP